MKKIIYLFIIMLATGCSSNQKIVDDTIFIKAFDLLEAGKTIEARPLLIQGCKKGIMAACYAQGKIGQEKRTQQYSIMQGATTETQTRINIVFPKNKKFKFMLWSNGKFHSKKNILVTEVKRKFSNWKIIKLHIQNLTEASVNHLSILGNHSSIADFRKFTTLKTKGKQLHFVAASCMSDTFQELQVKMWDQVFHKTKPEVIFNIGDTVYADWINNAAIVGGADPQTIWRRYVETWNSLDIYKMEQLIPVYALWDDHDFGKNNGGKEFKNKKEAKKTFLVFHAQNAQPNIIKGYGVGYALKLRSQMFYFLDNRYFRGGEKDRKATHFGSKQEKWLYRLMKKYQMPSWIISGDQFFGAYHPFESYEGFHPVSFKRFLTKLGKINRPLSFLSGDRHLAEIMKIKSKYLPFETYEITSSGIHTKMYPGSFIKNPNPRGIEGVDGKAHYMSIHSRAHSKTEISFDVTSLGLNEEILFSRKLNVKVER